MSILLSWLSVLTFLPSFFPWGYQTPCYGVRSVLHGHRMWCCLSHNEIHVPIAMWCKRKSFYFWMAVRGQWPLLSVKPDPIILQCPWTVVSSLMSGSLPRWCGLSSQGSSLHVRAFEVDIVEAGIFTASMRWCAQGGGGAQEDVFARFLADA